MGRRKKVVDRHNQLGEMLLQLRQEHQLSMKKLGQATGVSAAYICRLEAGERNPSRDLLLSLLEVLMPTASQAEKDQVMVAGGFAPSNYRNFMGREDVLSLYESLVQKDPSDFKSFIALVILYIRSGNYETADKQIQQGLKRFDDKVQLYALMAALELSKKNYEQAIAFQSEALELFQAKPDASSLRLKQHDLLLSRGIMFFESGNAQAYAYQKALLAAKMQAAEQAKDDALRDLKRAAQDFTLALSLNEDVYILDELARVNFTLAFLLQGETAQRYWQETVDAFERTICAPNKSALGYQALLQSTAFLGLSYAKNKDFKQAWLILNVIEACLPNYWLVHYIQANYFVLRYQTSQDQQNLEQAMQALRAAASIPDPLNRTREEAQHDLDFDVLRKKFPQEFEAFLRGKP